MLEQYDVAPDMFDKVCVIVDKVKKLPREQVEKELEALGVAAKTIDGELVDSVEGLQTVRIGC